MKMKILAAVAVAAAFTFGEARAAVLKATTTNTSLSSSFTIDFNDSNADGLLQYTEVTSFSGVWLLGSVFLPLLDSVPTIASISDHDSGAGGQSCPSLADAPGGSQTVSVDYRSRRVLTVTS